MHPKEIGIKSFQYDLPDDSIAKFPLANRHDSKLLVFQDNRIKDESFKHLDQFLPAQTLLVYNQTKVVHARLLFQKTTGAKVEVFCLEPDKRYPDVSTAMKQTNEVYWKCLLGGGAKWKSGQELILEVDGLVIHALRVAQEDGAWILKLSWTPEQLSFADVLLRAGKVPLPPYLNRNADAADTHNYQSMFAKEEGSVAAPTASLHFTPEVMDQLKQLGVKTAHVTLHVGAGTFKPVKAETMDGHEMHAEWLEVEAEQILSIKTQLEANLPIVPVGTTSCRTLESLYWIGLGIINGQFPEPGGIAVSQWLPYEHEWELVSAPRALEALSQYMIGQKMLRLITRTQIIIAPSYEFKIISGLITNFHQPESTLLLLVSALIGPNWKNVYDHALANHYRFLSYGDSSLLWPQLK